MGIVRFNVLADAYFLLAGVLSLSLLYSYLLYSSFPLSFLVVVFASSITHQHIKDTYLKRFFATIVMVSITFSIVEVVLQMFGIVHLIHLSALISVIILLVIAKFVRLTKARHVCLSNFVIAALIAAYFIPILSLIIVNSLTVSIMSTIIAVSLSAFFAYGVNQSLKNYPNCSATDLLFSVFGIFEYRISRKRY